MTASLIPNDNIIVLSLPDAGLDDRQFFELCQLNPDLKIERNLEALQAKIGEFIACGCRLARLVDPYERRTLVYEGEQPHMPSPSTRPCAAARCCPVSKPSRETP